ncbi:unnamed protein product, partial [Closterium sp. NIES-53]
QGQDAQVHLQHPGRCWADLPGGVHREDCSEAAQWSAAVPGRTGRQDCCERVVSGQHKAAVRIHKHKQARHGHGSCGALHGALPLLPRGSGRLSTRQGHPEQEQCERYCRLPIPSTASISCPL